MVRSWHEAAGSKPNSFSLHLPAHIAQRRDETVKPKGRLVCHLEAALRDRLGRRMREAEHVAQRILELPHRADVGGLDRAGARQLVHWERHQRDLRQRLDGLDGAARLVRLGAAGEFADRVADRQASSARSFIAP